MTCTFGGWYILFSNEIDIDIVAFHIIEKENPRVQFYAFLYDSIVILYLCATILVTHIDRRRQKNKVVVDRYGNDTKNVHFRFFAASWIHYYIRLNNIITLERYIYIYTCRLQIILQKHSENREIPYAYMTPIRLPDTGSILLKMKKNTFSFFQMRNT